MANAIRCNPGNEANKQIHLPHHQPCSQPTIITKNRQNNKQTEDVELYLSRQKKKNNTGGDCSTSQTPHLVSFTTHSQAPRVSETSLVILKNLNTHEIKYPFHPGGSWSIECNRKMFFHGRRSGISTGVSRVPGVSKIGSRSGGRGHAFKVKVPPKELSLNPVQAWASYVQLPAQFT